MKFVVNGLIHVEVSKQRPQILGHQGEGQLLDCHPFRSTLQGENAKALPAITIVSPAKNAAEEPLNSFPRE